jgi:hypothetical protein
MHDGGTLGFRSSDSIATGTRGRELVRPAIEMVRTRDLRHEALPGLP